MSTPKRRAILIALPAWIALSSTKRTLAQTKKPPIVIGWLEGGSRTTSYHRLVAFKEGMAALGWKEGAQYVIEERWAGGDAAAGPKLASELAVKKPAIIVAAPSQMVLAAAKAASNVPVVQANGASPVSSGVAKTLAHPGGMVTGLTNLTESVDEKYLEILLLAIPRLRRVGFLLDGRSRDPGAYVKSAKRSAAQYKVEARFAEAADAQGLDTALAKLSRDKVEAIVLTPSGWFTHERQRIADYALKQRWPVIGGPDEFAQAGALLSYGNNRTELYRRAAYFVDKILKGAEPGDLPIEQPMRIELVVNNKTAKALGLKLPPGLLARADKVIE